MSTFQARQPAGSPTGGQFAATGRSEADLDLADDVTANEADYQVVDPWYDIPEWAIDDAQNRIDKANVRLERAGIEERIEATWADNFENMQRDGHKFRTKRLTLTTPVVSRDGWAFVGTVEPVEGTDELVVRTVRGVELGGYAPENNTCDHCGQSRRRSRSHVLRNTETGELKQVGTSCVQEFTGIKPQGLAALEFEMPWTVSGGDYWRPPSTEYEHEEVRDIIARALVLTDGGKHYVSREAAIYGASNSTSDILKGTYSPPHTRQAREELDALKEAASRVPTEDINDVLAIAQSLGDDSDYGRNLRILTAQETVSHRMMGFVASAVAVWSRERDRRVQREQQSPPSKGYLAGVKEKIAGHKAVVEKVRELETYTPAGIRPSTLVILRAESGHQLKWFASGRKDLKPGQNLTFTGGTVKEHAEYNDTDQTVLTRVKYEVDQTP